jgi:hypothetical protein
MAEPVTTKKATSKQLVDPPTKLSTMDKIKADQKTQILGPDAMLMRDLKGKHMIGGRRTTRGKR